MLEANGLCVYVRTLILVSTSLPHLFKSTYLGSVVICALWEPPGKIQETTQTQSKMTIPILIS